MKTKNLKTLMLATTAFLLGTQAFAQADHNGNGGDAISCNGGRSYVMLDAIEAQRQRDAVIPERSGTVREIVNELLNRLATRDSRGIEYRALAEAMVSDIEAANGQPYLGKVIRFANESLTDIPDSDESLLLDGCNKKQLIIQQKQIYPEDRLFLIDNRVWTLMSPTQQALGVMHEMFFHEALNQELKAKNSRGSRYLNALLASDQFNAVNVCDWNNRVLNSKFQTIKLPGVLQMLTHFYTKPVPETYYWAAPSVVIPLEQQQPILVSQLPKLLACTTDSNGRMIARSGNNYMLSSALDKVFGWYQTSITLNSTSLKASASFDAFTGEVTEVKVNFPLEIKDSKDVYCFNRGKLVADGKGGLKSVDIFRGNKRCTKGNPVNLSIDANGQVTEL